MFGNDYAPQFLDIDWCRLIKRCIFDLIRSKPDRVLNSSMHLRDVYSIEEFLRECSFSVVTLHILHLLHNRGRSNTFAIGPARKSEHRGLMVCPLIRCEVDAQMRFGATKYSPDSTYYVFTGPGRDTSSRMKRHCSKQQKRKRGKRNMNPTARRLESISYLLPLSTKWDLAQCVN